MEARILGDPTLEKSPTGNNKAERMVLHVDRTEMQLSETHNYTRRVAKDELGPGVQPSSVLLRFQLESECVKLHVVYVASVGFRELKHWNCTYSLREYDSPQS